MENLKETIIKTVSESKAQRSKTRAGLWLLHLATPLYTHDSRNGNLWPARLMYRTSYNHIIFNN